MPDSPLSVMIVGATGLVGRECLRLLLADNGFSRIVVLTRRPLSPVVRSPKLETHVIDFEHLNEYDELFRV
ncbi:MAG: hypothetical protein JF602_06415, partial [Gemmatimonadetes bacterium]|nr:hypothetical protein [Gemmatimonadota bacterium]